MKSETLPTTDYKTLTACVKAFLEGAADTAKWPEIIVLGVASPVVEGAVDLSNTEWPKVHHSELEKELGVKSVSFINDFVALGYGVLNSPSSAFLKLNDAPVQEGLPKALIGAGTGLGEGYLTRGEDSLEYSVHGSEGGHTDFPPRSEEEFALLQFTRKEIGVQRISIERVCAGPAIPLIFRFVRDRYPDLKSNIDHLKPTGPEVFEQALENDCPTCIKVLEIFTSLYGCEAGNLAVKTLCYGGLYIAGGVTARIRSYMQKSSIFMDNFLDKGRMRTLMEKIPILVLTEEVGINGAEEYAFRVMKHL